MADTKTLPGNNAEVRVYYLIDQQDSQFVKKGTEGTIFEQRLKTLSAYRYPSESTCVVDENGMEVVKQLRYIQGCDTPFVDEQEKRGYRFDPNRDIIWFEHGKLSVVNSAYTRGLFKYLELTTGNEDSPNRNKNVPAKFREFKPVKEAVRDIQLIALEKEMVDMVMGLYKEKGGEYIFEKAKIDFLCTLFAVHAPSYEEKIPGLVAIAKANPNAFKNTIIDQKNLYKVAILEGVELGVISIEGPKASYIATNTPFYTFEARSKDAKIDELLVYLLSEAGTQMFNQMQIDIRAKKDTIANQIV
jgi:hypothetical protein